MDVRPKEGGHTITKKELKKKRAAPPFIHQHTHTHKHACVRNAMGGLPREASGFEIV